MRIISCWGISSAVQAQTKSEGNPRPSISKNKKIREKEKIRRIWLSVIDFEHGERAKGEGAIYNS